MHWYVAGLSQGQGASICDSGQWWIKSVFLLASCYLEVPCLHDSYFSRLRSWGELVKEPDPGCLYLSEATLGIFSRNRSKEIRLKKKKKILGRIGRVGSRLGLKEWLPESYRTDPLVGSYLWYHHWKAQFENIAPWLWPRVQKMELGNASVPDGNCLLTPRSWRLDAGTLL